MFKCDLSELETISEEEFLYADPSFDSINEIYLFVISAYDCLEVANSDLRHIKRFSLMNKMYASENDGCWPIDFDIEAEKKGIKQSIAENYSKLKEMYPELFSS